MNQPRYHVAIYHGEHATVYNVMDRETGDCIASYSTGKHASQSHKLACACRDVHNEQEKRRVSA